MSQLHESLGDLNDEVITHQGFTSISEELTKMTNDGDLGQEKKRKKKTKMKIKFVCCAGSHGGAPPSWSAGLPAGR